MKKILIVILSLTMLFSLCACGTAAAPQASPTVTEAPQVSASPLVEPTDAVATEEPTFVDVLSADARAAYVFALQQLAFEHVYPDGTDAGFDSAFGYIEDNSFALFDVDGDGAQELIISFTTASMAGNIESIYKYNSQTNSLDRVFAAFPSVTYYSNGLILADWSHNQGFSGDALWPYTVYSFATGSDAEAATELASVDAWNRVFSETDFNGQPFPAEADADGDGIVYLITQGETRAVDKAEYEAWFAELIGSADVETIPYQKLTEENIAALAAA